eukprot:GAHX01001237.1.p2 GENE.GAHX01001237.1~~GAHX01001237.1.p2  ORF type:complete len:63 (-),score=7.56 GAHX01001237.1:1279-1467(-)
MHIDGYFSYKLFDCSMGIETFDMGRFKEYKLILEDVETRNPFLYVVGLVIVVKPSLSNQQIY